MSDYLHNHPEFNELLTAVGTEKQIDPYLVAKDYWIMHALFGLKAGGYDFQLKGGTSLSKGYQIIHRFSEDIDLRITPPEDIEVEENPKKVKPKHCESRKHFFDSLTNGLQIEGIEEIVRDEAYDDVRYYRNAGIRLNYPNSSEALVGVKSGILLEVGFDVVTPNKAIDIDSWALGFAKTRKMDVIDNTAIGISCYDPRYTFVEKLQTIANKYRQQQEKGTLPKNFIRHYYDVMCLLKEQAVQEFIGTEEYLKHKESRFVGKVRGIDLAKEEAFLLSDKATRDLYEKEYLQTKDLYYQGQPPFDEILAVIRESLPRL